MFTWDQTFTTTLLFTKHYYNELLYKSEYIIIFKDVQRKKGRKEGREEKQTGETTPRQAEAVGREEDVRTSRSLAGL